MAEPSKVIHFRNVPSDATELDVQQLAQSFGPVQKVVVMRAKNQALLEMQDIAAAINMIQFYSGVQPAIKGRNVYVQFSSHQVLTSNDNQNRSHQEGQPNRIILVTIHNPLYPINVDVLHQVFSPHGFVEKIVTFQKAAGLQALVQYNNQQSANQAKNNLQGRNIYDGCCTLDIQFSNLTELQVHYNNERTRDYINQLPDQPGKGGPGGNIMTSLFGEGGNMYGGMPGQRPGGFPGQMGQPGMPQPGLGGLGPGGFPGAPMAAAAAAQLFGGNLPPGVSGTNDRTTLLVSNINNEQVDADKLFNLFSNYGNVLRIKFLHQKPDHALVQLADGLQAELAVLYLKGANVFGKRLEVNYSKYPSINPSPDTKDYSASNLNRFGRNAAKNYRHCCAPTRMIHCSNLPADATAEMVVEALAPHGTIAGSKLFEKDGKKQVLVLFETVEGATDALVAKHASTLGANTIRLAFSKNTSL
eukprot:TRINITY_DN14241_c0_g3_i2.p1 TRINITY_DN14241_c0_g3~~TRINITY_DN14241_c0_g3_i2.p1  ORF type:complete len:472 (-),score=73.79 TRINITY_DN14241_c0_g3_i2:67-1482(-)